MHDPLSCLSPRAALLAAALALGLAACSQPANQPTPAPAEPAAGADVQPQVPEGVTLPAPVDDFVGEQPQLVCNADAVQSLVGEHASEALVARATAESGSASVRVLRPGQPATMDYRQDRLNILTDDAGTIERLSCG